MAIEYKNSPLVCREEQSIWVVGDVHGCYDEFMDVVGNPAIKDDDIVILVGDIIDRGSESVKMLKWAMENVNKDGKYILIRGNHEQGVIDSYYKLKASYKKRCDEIGAEKEQFKHYKEFYLRSMMAPYDFTDYMEKADIRTVGDAEPYIHWMRRLPHFVRVDIPGIRKYVVAHSWFNGELEEDGGIYVLDGDSDILDTRDVDFYDRLLDTDYSPMEDEMLIHGHTPIVIIDGHRNTPAVPIIKEYSVNIDGGCCYGKECGGRLIALCLNDGRVIYSE